MFFFVKDLPAIGRLHQASIYGFIMMKNGFTVG